MTTARLSDTQRRMLQELSDGKRAPWRLSDWRTASVLHDLGMITSDDPGASTTSRGEDALIRARIVDPAP